MELHHLTRCSPPKSRVYLVTGPKAWVIATRAWRMDRQFARRERDGQRRAGSVAAS
jgi:hypothetical protein